MSKLTLSDSGVAHINRMKPSKFKIIFNYTLYFLFAFSLLMLSIINRGTDRLFYFIIFLLDFAFTVWIIILAKSYKKILNNIVVEIDISTEKLIIGTVKSLEDNGNIELSLDNIKVEKMDISHFYCNINNVIKITDIDGKFYFVIPNYFSEQDKANIEKTILIH